MGFPSKPIHVVTLGLAILMAWPWNLALSTIETSQTAIAAGVPMAIARGHQGGHRIGRPGRWALANCPAVSPDCESAEEEGDDFGPFHAVAEVLPGFGPPGAFEPPSGCPVRPSPDSPQPFTRLCRLRC